MRSSLRYRQSGPYFFGSTHHCLSANRLRAALLLVLVMLPPPVSAENDAVSNKPLADARSRLASTNVASTNAQSASNVAQDSNAESRTEVVDMVIASIDGEPVTSSDLRRYVRMVSGKELGDIHSGGSEVRQFVRDLVLARLFDREAEKLGIAVNSDEIDAYVSEIKQQNAVDDAGFQALLESRGLSLDDYRDQVRNEILRSRIVANRVRSKISVSDEEIDKELEGHDELRQDEGEVALQQIFARRADLTSDQYEALKNEFQSLRTKLVEGGDWRTLGGDRYSNLGFVATDELLPALRDALSKLEPGAVSDVVESSQGLHILSLQPSDEIADSAQKAARE
ncbi:MAG: SurA N-terminal domain-containing protein, partial [Bdellovibrionales bacterium]|nr:SurA N-terminal domain-containing protein [Bdellovibrionales bacterium]